MSNKIKKSRITKYANLDDFANHIEEVFGVYLDAIQGFRWNYDNFIKNQISAGKQCNLTIEELDVKPLMRSNGPPPVTMQEITTLLHVMPQGQYKQNNGSGGLNSRRILLYCLSDIVDYWNEFKSEKLKLKGAKDADVLPLMTYLKSVRDLVIHHRITPNKQKVAAYECRHAKYALPAFERLGNIELSKDDIEAIVRELRMQIRELYADNSESVSNVVPIYTIYQLIAPRE